MFGTIAVFINGMLCSRVLTAGGLVILLTGMKPKSYIKNGIKYTRQFIEGEWYEVAEHPDDMSFDEFHSRTNGEKRPYAPRAELSTDKAILKMLGNEPRSLDEIVRLVKKDVAPRTVYLRLLALVKQGKIHKEGNAKKSRYTLTDGV